MGKFLRLHLVLFIFLGATFTILYSSESRGDSNNANKYKETILFEADSIYNHITIRQIDNERCMLFGQYRSGRETCIKLDEPDFSVFEYTSVIFVSFLVKPEPKRIALLGLGGGYLPIVFNKYLPEIDLDVVEVDPLVEKLAKEYFNFVATPKISLTVCDGRQYLKRTDKLYDHIWIDTFNSDYIPAHMTTKEFLQLSKTKLSKGGIVVQNVHRSNRLYDAHIATFQSVFKYVYVFVANVGNSILIGCDKPSFSPSEWNNQLRRFNGKIGKINLAEQLQKYQQNPQIRETKVLTDDYSPANLWIHQK